MKKNMGGADRIVRTLLAVIFAALYFTATVTGTLGIVLLIVGGIFLVTSLFGTCPLYSMIGIKTCKIE